MASGRSSRRKGRGADPAPQRDDVDQLADQRRELPFIAGAHSLSGTAAENYRHTIVRAAFVTELCAHPRVIIEFNRWGDETGIFTAVEAFVKSTDTVVKQLGLPSRASVFSADTVDQALAAVGAGALGRIKRHCATLGKSADQLKRRLAEGIGSLAEPSAALTRELLRPGWPWVAYDLVESFAVHIEGYALGASQGVLETQVGISAPETSMTFTTGENEDRDHAMQRLTEMYLATMAKLEHSGKDQKAGRLPGTKGHASLARDARWFYRHHVLGEESDALALDYCDQERAQHHYPHTRRGHTWRNDRKTVSDGIKNAARLLGEIPQYVWRD